MREEGAAFCKSSGYFFGQEKARVVRVNVRVYVCVYIYNLVQLLFAEKRGR